MRDEPVRRAFGFHLFSGFAESQRLRLGKNVGEEHVVMPSQRCQGLGEGDEIARDQPGALVDQLIKGMLAIGAGLAPINRAGLIIDMFAGQGDVLAVALHGELLQVGREPF